jgi:hypothetical protein
MVSCLILLDDLWLEYNFFYTMLQSQNSTDLKLLTKRELLFVTLTLIEAYLKINNLGNKISFSWFDENNKRLRTYLSSDPSVKKFSFQIRQSPFYFLDDSNINSKNPISTAFKPISIAFKIEDTIADSIYKAWLYIDTGAQFALDDLITEGENLAKLYYFSK